LSDHPWELSETGENSICSCVAKIEWQSGTDETARLVRADRESAYGWQSKHYAAVEPTTALLIEMKGSKRDELITEFIPLGSER
jgi:hypothetical protein